MKFVVISDTHGQHAKVYLPPGDVLIHAGDISKRGKEEEIKDFLNWFKDLPYEHKIFIAGNHDFYFEKAPKIEIEKIIPSNVIYLNDSGVTIDGIKIWGSPITPTFFNWAFNRDRGNDITAHWNLIPSDTEILITHGPVHKILDKVMDGTHVGCEDLLKKVQKTKPKVHVFGHIHEAYGQHKIDGTTFVNASVLDEDYVMRNKPVIFEIK